MSARRCLFDVTRLISRSWTGRRSTGIDRVCYAYLAHFGGSAHAVVQHAGLFRVFNSRDSDRLFALLEGPDHTFRKRLAAFAPMALARAKTRVRGEAAFYFNVSHTEFDLESHLRWIAASNLRSIYLIHDLIPITHAKLCRDRAVARHRGRVLNALRSAAGIIVSSSATARELEDYARVQALPLPPVLTAPLAGATFSRAEPDLAVPLRGDPYFVCLGTIEPRKNHLTLLTAWRSLTDALGVRTPRLFMIGQWGADSSEVRRMLRNDAALRRYVVVLDRCPDDVLGELIAGARAMLLPSMAEGFGLPMVEALGLGTPVIASDLPCFREIGQGVPNLLDPLDAAAWQHMIHAFTGDCADRVTQMSRIAGFRAPTWDQHFTRVERWLADLERVRRRSIAATASANTNHLACHVPAS